MDITIGDYLKLVDMVKPKDWILSPEDEPFSIGGCINHKEEEIMLILSVETMLSEGGVFSSPKSIGLHYSGTLFYNQIYETWDYICPTKVGIKKIAEEGDSRLESKFDEVLHRFAEYAEKEEKRNKAVIKDILSRRRERQKNGTHN
jgi:hypothetical protein